MRKRKPKPRPRGEPVFAMRSRAVDKKIQESTLAERLKDGFRLLEGKEIES